MISLRFSIQLNRTKEGHWAAEMPRLPAVQTFGDTPEEAAKRAKVLAFRVLAEELANDDRGDFDEVRFTTELLD